MGESRGAWYAVQVEAGREERSCRRIGQFLEASGRCDGAVEELFVPMRRVVAPVGKSAPAKDVPLFSGYLIAVARRQAAGELAAALRRAPVFARLLCSGGEPLPLSEGEVALICAFMGRGTRVVGASEGFIERGRVTVVAGPLVGHEAQIVKVNRRRRTARVEFQICGRTVQAELALSLMKANKQRRREAGQR